jgi:hypothetical protein
MSDTSKILKEISNLTTNLDVLVKELKETNSLTKETNKDLSSLVKDKKDSGTEDKTAEKSGGEKNFKNFSESIINSLSNQNQGLIVGLEKILKGAFQDQSKSGVKPAGVESQGQVKPGLVTKDLISAVAGRLLNIPKLEDGGKINSTGVALVGEKGPELVELQKGSVINSQDKMAELIKMEMEDLKKSKTNQETPGIAKNQEATKIVSGSPQLDEFVTNSFGVKVPKSEIDAYRKEIYDEFKEDFDKEPSLLEDEIKQFINNYRETMTVSDLQKLSEKTQPKEIKISEEELQKDKSKKSGEEKEKLSALFGSKIPEKLQNFVEKNSKIISQSGILNKPETSSSVNPNQISSGLQALTEKLKADNPNMEFSKDMQTLKSKETKSPASTPPSSEPVTQQITPSSNVESSIQPEKPKKEPIASKSNEASDGISGQDVKDIKALLTGIYRQLSGPLNIANDLPFRPNSNVL